MSHDADGTRVSAVPTSPVNRRNPDSPVAKPDTNRAVDVQVISRASDIMRAISDAPGGASLAQIAAATSLSRSTVHRIVVALCRQEFLRATTAGYRLGPALLRFGEAVRSNFTAAVRPHLQALSNTLRETVDLSELTGQSVTFIDQVIAPRRLRAVSATGLSFPLHCTAPGKAILAALDDEAVSRLLPERLDRFTPATLTTRAELEADLEAARRTGVAFDREEHTLGICAVGVGLTGPDGSWFALSVPLPAQRFYGQETRLVSALKRAVEGIVNDRDVNGA